MHAAPIDRGRGCLRMFLCLSLLGIARLSAGAETAELPTGGLVLILDSSGSMSEPLDGRPKIDIAKEVLSGVVSNLPYGINVQLVVYGNRAPNVPKKGEIASNHCREVETVIPLGPLDQTNLLAKIAAMRPGGPTPIMYAIQTVAAGLAGVEDAAILLVSDGRDTCGGDPCAAVKELKETGIRFVMHVIGFGRNEQEDLQLACLGKAGGGMYFTATNAAEFKFAAEKVVQKTGEASGYLRVIAQHKGQPLDAPCQVVKAGGSGQGPALASGGTGEQGRTFKLLPGTYDVIVENLPDAGSAPIRFERVVVETGKTVVRTAEFSIPSLTITTLRNGQPFGAASQIFRADGGEWVESKPADAAGLVAFHLEPGAYDVELLNEMDQGSQPVRYTNVVIAADTTVHMTNNFLGGTLTLATWLRGRPVVALCQVTPSGERVSYYGRSRNGVADFNLVPGTYDVKVATEDGLISQVIPGVAVLANEKQALEVFLEP